MGIAPVVIDLLNLYPSFQHHWKVYGEWSPAIDDYVKEDIMNWTESKEYEKLIEITDPYSYRFSLNMPKYIINASSDEFLLPIPGNFIGMTLWAKNTYNIYQMLDMAYMNICN